MIANLLPIKGALCYTDVEHVYIKEAHRKT